METRSRGGHLRYDLRPKFSSKSQTKTTASNVSRPRKKPKLTNGLHGEYKVMKHILVRDRKPGSSESLDEELAKKEIIEAHLKRMRVFANRALRLHRSSGGKIYEVVDIYGHGLGIFSHGAVRHLNFAAKRKGDPNAPVEVFFAEFISTRYEKDRANICRPLGLSAQLLQKCNETNGCQFCYLKGVSHPPRGEFAAEIEDVR